MRWDDQEKIKEKVGGRGGGKSSEPAAASSGADDLMVEYAKSNRSKCKKCKDQIDKVRFRKFYFISLYKPKTSFKGLSFFKKIALMPTLEKN